MTTVRRDWRSRSQVKVMAMDQVNAVCPTSIEGSFFYSCSLRCAPYYSWSHFNKAICDTMYHIYVYSHNSVDTQNEFTIIHFKFAIIDHISIRSPDQFLPRTSSNNTVPGLNFKNCKVQTMKGWLKRVYFNTGLLKATLNLQHSTTKTCNLSWFLLTIPVYPWNSINTATDL